MASGKTRAQEILTKGAETLLSLDESFVFKTGDTRRDFPHFDAAEIVAGAELGKGGFSSVYEVDRINILGTTPEAVINVSDDSDSCIAPSSAKLNLEHHDHHYDVATARDFMSRHYQRNGSARYAIKKLRSDLGETNQARGAVDLAIEITFLTTIWHPNIIKMRGYSRTPRVSLDTFIILDRLYGTLDDKIEMWAQMMATSKAGCCGASESSPAMSDLLKQRLLVAYDLSSALNYLHELKLLYRDLKPENIGFDIRGDVKLFDFGLSRSLEPSCKEKDGYGYKLTAKTGSIPYMAPEIALGKPYSYEVDVYSFSILLWEIISLEWAFNGFDAKNYFLHVCERNLRPTINRKWPAIVRMIIQEGWDPKPQERPSMKRIRSMLRGGLEDLFSDVDMSNRTQYMMNKSTRSARGITSNSPRGGQGSGRCSILGSRSVRPMYVCGDDCGDHC